MLVLVWTSNDIFLRFLLIQLFKIIPLKVEDVTLRLTWWTWRLSLCAASMVKEPVCVFLFKQVCYVMFWYLNGSPDWQKLKGHSTSITSFLHISNSIQEFKLNSYRNFQLILPIRFHCMWYFVNSVIFRVSQKLLYCAFNWSRLRKIENVRNIHISSKVSQSRTWNSVCSHYPCQHVYLYKNPNLFCFVFVFVFFVFALLLLLLLFV